MVKSLEAIEHYPWGVGLGNFTVYSGTWREVHVAYLQLGAEGGIAALVLYLMFFARGFDNLRKIRRMPVHDPEMDLFAGALFATLIGFVVGALFAPEAYQLFPYFAVAYTSVLYAIAQARQGSGGPPPDLPNRSQRRLRSQGGSRVLAPVGSGESSRALTTPLRNQR
jgi:O-antigen ligase